MASRVAAPAGTMPRSLPAHIPALDGVRGLAILAVLICHSWPDTFLHHGALGVDLFFALSGFLITGILLDTRETPHYLRNFYVRRALRLFPLAFAWLAVCAFLLPLLHRLAGASMRDYAGPWWWYLVYLQNLKPGNGANDAYLGHFWSLAVEEQFYLAWPFIVLATTRRSLVWICGFIIAGSLALRTFWTLQGVDWNVVYRHTLARIDTIAMGALVAVAIRSGVRLPRWPVVLIAAGLLAAPLERTLAQTLAGIGFASLVYAGASSRVAWLELTPLRLLGKYSYCLYVIHIAVIQHVSWLAAYFVKKGAPAWVVPASPVFSLALCYGLAVLSFRYFESPLLALKHRFSAKRSRAAHEVTAA